MCEYVQAKEVNSHGLIGRGLFVYSSFNINIYLLNILGRNSNS